jgi:rubrerythrin
LTPSALVQELEDLRLAEKEQALAYRNIAARAESAGLVDLAQRFHDLHADEQHHLSRLTARVLELGARPADLNSVKAGEIPLDDWQANVRDREQAEIDRYTALDLDGLDQETRSLVESIIEVERHHASELGGKWTMA